MDLRIVPINTGFIQVDKGGTLTQGRGVFTMEPSEYSAVPRSLQEVIVKEALARKAAKK